DQPLDLGGAAVDFAAAVAILARGGAAGEHAVFGGDPADRILGVAPPGGTSFSMLAVHRMVVCPALISRLPGAALRKGRSIVTGRSWSAARPSWRVVMKQILEGRRSSRSNTLRMIRRVYKRRPKNSMTTSPPPTRHPHTGRRHYSRIALW